MFLTPQDWEKQRKAELKRQRELFDDVNDFVLEESG